MSGWLTVRRGERAAGREHSPRGNRHPGRHRDALVSPWLARKDTDWWVDRLYDFAADSTPRSSARRSRGRSSTSIATRPAPRSIPARPPPSFARPTTFDGEPLYQAATRRRRGRDRAAQGAGFAPYHAALPTELERLRARARARRALRLPFDPLVIPGCSRAILPHFNIGTNGGSELCDPS